MLTLLIKHIGVSFDQTYKATWLVGTLVGHSKYKELSHMTINLTIMTIGENGCKTMENIMVDSCESNHIDELHEICSIVFNDIWLTLQISEMKLSFNLSFCFHGLLNQLMDVIKNLGVLRLRKDPNS